MEMAMRFELDRLPSDPVLLQRMLREMAELLEQERAALNAAKAVVTTQGLTIEKLEHRLARLLRVQFGRSSEKMEYRPVATDVRRNRHACFRQR